VLIRRARESNMDRKVAWSKLENIVILTLSTGIRFSYLYKCCLFMDGFVFFNVQKMHIKLDKEVVGN